MRGILGWIVALFISSPVAAQEVAPEDVILPSVQDDIAACLREPGRAKPSAALACFERPGVTTGAQNLSRAIIDNTEFGLAGILVGFRETGQVDVAEIFFPKMANTNFQTAFVNTADGVQMAADLNFTRNPPNVPSTRAILAQYPQAFESGRVSVVALRSLPGGSQRFVLVDIVTDGCRACAPVATSLRYFDFVQGRRVSSMEVGWQPWQDITMSQAASRIRNGNIATIQDRLNHMGYDAGPADGIAGTRTTAAIMSFKRDYCLPEDNRISDSFVTYLTPEKPNVAVPPCAPGSSIENTPSLPFPDGVYAADARLCPPAPLAVRTESGDRDYSLVIDVADGTWNWAGSFCTIRQANETSADLALRLDCLAEGISQQEQVMLAATHEEGFSYRGREFWRCQMPATELPLPAGVYAHDDRLCPGSPEKAPNEVVFEADARPLFIKGSEFSWDHAACKITAARQAGPNWGVDLSCAGGNKTFETTQSVTLLADNKVLFEGFERSWCGPEIEPLSQEIKNTGVLPVDLEEGVYSFEVKGCPEFDEKTRNEREQIAANLRVTLRDGEFNQGDQSCPIANFTTIGDQTYLEMDCTNDGSLYLYRFDMTPKDRNSFERYNNTYKLCKSGVTQDKLESTMDRIAYSAEDYRYWKQYDDIRGDRIRNYLVGRALTLSRTGQVTGLAALLNDPAGKPSPETVVERIRKHLSKFLELSEVMSVFQTGEGVWRNNDLGELYTLYVMNRARSQNQPASFSYGDLKAESFVLEPPEKSVFHAIDLDVLQVEKWTHPDGREYVYRRGGDGAMRQVFDGTNDGTYNYCVTGVCHTVLDVLPWVLWGATPRDTTTPEERAELLVDNGRLMP